MSIHRFKYLFQKFVTKTASPEEREEFMAMIKDSNYDNELQLLLDEHWQQPSSDTPMNEAKAELLFNQIMASNVNIEPVKLERTRNWKWLKAAAAIFILIGLSVMLFKLDSHLSDNRQVAVIKNSKPIDPDKPGRRFINLPDGSSVILNENSKLEFGDKLIINGKREVYLIGEAYFDIKHDAEHPFIVHTGELQTTVLGTAFNINAAPESGKLTVTVTRGKVKVGDNKKTFNEIDPNEQMIVDIERNQNIKRTVDAKAFTAWKNEDIYFEDVSIADVANQLQERFDVSIVFSSKAVKNCRFSATFLKTQSLEQILNVIAEFNQIKYHFKDNKTVLLDGSECK